MKRIVIRIVCYNQEDVISRALDSVLCQKDWGLFRVVVCDDCSKDRTWEILQKYKSSFPDIVEIHRNDHNLGIYGNVEKSDQYIKAIDYDLMGGLSGDDEYCDGYFERVQKLIEENHIDIKEAIGIYFDWKAVHVGGKELIYKQDAVLTGENLWSLYVRFKISGRSLMITKSVRDNYEPMLHGKGLNLVESHYDSQPPLIIRRAYYCPFVASVYYTGIGVSTRLSPKHSDYATKQNIEKWQYFLEHYVKSEEDKYYARYEKRKAEYYMSPKLKSLPILFFLYYKGQLKSCRSTLKETLRTFFNLAKYRFSY